MKRIALVTGGTRGLGKAIALALRDAGCQVAATYHSDEGAARRMQDETGIPALRWDVADFNACRDGVRRGRRAQGGRPAGTDRRARQQCGDHGRRHVPQDEPGTMVAGSAHQSRVGVQRDTPGHRGHARAALRAHRKHQLGQRTQGAGRPGQLCGCQGWHPRFHQGVGAGKCRAQHHGQRGGARLLRYRDDGGSPARGSARDRRRHPGGPPGHAGRRRWGGGFLLSWQTKGAASSLVRLSMSTAASTWADASGPRERGGHCLLARDTGFPEPKVRHPAQARG
jgi:hypothetical protein